jgi:tRNA pseudouridine55 synthase
MYKYARDGIKVDKEARTITINQIDHITIDLPKVSFDIACSKGTYIRSIARDLGNQLKCGGHLSDLIRTSQEKFSINDASSIDEVSEDKIIPLENAFDNLNSITLDQDDASAFINGVALELKIDHSNLLRVYDPSKKFIAIGKNTSQGFKHEYLV